MPSDPTVEEVRELLEFIDKRPKCGVLIHERIVTSSTVAALCRSYLAAQDAEDEPAAKPPMSAGEFAGWVIAEFSQSHYRQAISERITELAAEHNIEIVEPKK